MRDGQLYVANGECAVIVGCRQADNADRHRSAGRIVFDILVRRREVPKRRIMGIAGDLQRLRRAEVVPVDRERVGILDPPIPEAADHRDHAVLVDGDGRGERGAGLPPRGSAIERQIDEGRGNVVDLDVGGRGVAGKAAIVGDHRGDRKGIPFGRLIEIEMRRREGAVDGVDHDGRARVGAAQNRTVAEIDRQGVGIERADIRVAAADGHGATVLEGLGWVHSQRTEHRRRIVHLQLRLHCRADPVILVGGGSGDRVIPLLQILVRDVEVRRVGGQLVDADGGAIAPVDAKRERIVEAGIDDPAAEPGKIALIDLGGSGSGRRRHRDVLQHRRHVDDLHRDIAILVGRLAVGDAGLDRIFPAIAIDVGRRDIAVRRRRIDDVVTDGAVAPIDVPGLDDVVAGRVRRGQAERVGPAFQQARRAGRCQRRRHLVDRDRGVAVDHEPVFVHHLAVDDLLAVQPQILPGHGRRIGRRKTGIEARAVDEEAILQGLGIDRGHCGRAADGHRRGLAFVDRSAVGEGRESRRTRIDDQGNRNLDGVRRRRAELLEAGIEVQRVSAFVVDEERLELRPGQRHRGGVVDARADVPGIAGRIAGSAAAKRECIAFLDAVGPARLELSGSGADGQAIGARGSAVGNVLVDDAGDDRRDAGGEINVGRARRGGAERLLRRAVAPIDDPLQCPVDRSNPDRREIDAERRAHGRGMRAIRDGDDWRPVIDAYVGGGCRRIAVPVRRLHGDPIIADVVEPEVEQPCPGNRDRRRVDAGRGSCGRDRGHVAEIAVAFDVEQ